MGKAGASSGVSTSALKHAAESDPPMFSKRAKKQAAVHHLTNSKPSALSVEKNAAPEVIDEDEEITFRKLGLGEWLDQTLKELGIAKPSPVQRACVPHVLRGEDVIGCAQTGSGKTAAFALPILQKLAEDPFGVFALVLTPTRELAFQIADQFRALGSKLGLRDAVVIGGMEMTSQAVALSKRPHVVIATPGRLYDHFQSSQEMAGWFSRLRFLVLDEADRLLDVGFEKEMGGILKRLPQKRQTLLFSATMTQNLRQLQDTPMTGGKAPFHFQAYEGLRTVEALKQEYLFVPANVKDVYLTHLMDGLEEQKVRSVIIFTSTCKSAQLLQLLLEELEISSVALHSARSQNRRLAALDRFKSGAVPVLVATDVASRGLDIPTVDLVINYDIPRYAKDYVHRVGRTARAGRGGGAVSLVTQYDVELIQSIEGLLGRQLEERTVVEDEVLKGITKVYKARRVAALKMSESGFEDVLEARKKRKNGGRSQEIERPKRRKHKGREGKGDG
ncbi:putative dead box ATP-dependent RNA helicase [Klebsormidium nitens]|uniref:Putative dead box ATP-dependent RNA helicase n=1 Tax=Klebsormidium nitens TaxID=105231 RepID=A0A1Y1IN69_KLENI|nr:putative dead box ATP-dependent RNA helicase [Klebsormidium nitens]|eukprot:GAQ90611.1 putative dead box ATP-dependent RNA helicase [Klebsormidium nitens]